MRKVNEDTKDLIKKWEGFRAKAYVCPAGKWTIGWGHTTTAKPGMVITEEEAERLLEDDLRQFEAGVEKLLKRPATDGQFGAFVSLAFNIGLENFKNSTTLRRFNSDDFAGAAEALTWFNKARVKGKLTKLKGLVDRREDERKLFWSDIQNDYEVVEGEPEGPVTGGEQKPMSSSKTFWAGASAALIATVQQVSETILGLPIPPEYAIAAIAVISGFIMFNRWREARAGIH